MFAPAESCPSLKANKCLAALFLTLPGHLRILPGLLLHTLHLLQESV